MTSPGRLWQAFTASGGNAPHGGLVESTLRSGVVKALSKFHAVPVENGVCPGTPDVAFTHGWVELKQIPAWPARPDTVVRCDHFTRTQRNWLAAHEAAGGRCWVLLQVGRSEFLLIPGAKAAAQLGRIPRKELTTLAEMHWTGNIKRLVLAF